MENLQEIVRVATPQPKPRISFRQRLRKIFSYLILTAVLVAIPICYHRWTILKRFYLEKDTPSISILEQIPGLGAETSRLWLNVEDKGAGIDEVVVRIRQKNLSAEVLREHFGGKFFDFIVAEGPLARTHQKKIEVTLNAKTLKFKPGTVDISVTAFDRAVWSNSSVLEFSLPVDYSRPKVQVISPQHNAILGGTELVFYRIKGMSGEFKGASGVQLNQLEFPGFQAKDLDPAFENQPDVYLSFFPVPLWMKSSGDELKLFARNQVGNSSTSGFYYRVQRKVFPLRKVKVNLSAISPKLLSVYKELNAEKDYTAAQESSTDELEVAQRRYKFANESLRQLTETRLQNILTEKRTPHSRRYWSGVFSRPNFREISSFGEERLLLEDDVELSRNRQWGSDFAVPNGSPVYATNSGVVLYSGALGVYGTAVIIDHGFGLTTLYGHLQKASLNPGDPIHQGDMLGLSGSSGLVDSGTLRLEFRLHGIPVRPVEFWDETWLKEHIEKKIMQSKLAVVGGR